MYIYIHRHSLSHTHRVCPCLLQVTALLQRKVLERHGVEPARMAAALWLLRCASQLWPDDPELNGPGAISLYVRTNLRHLLTSDTYELTNLRPY